MMKAIRISVKGKVYKVGYRFYIKQVAEKNGISGKVFYQRKNQVLIYASGKPKDLEKFVALCRLGCPGSVIEHMTITEYKAIAETQIMEITENQQIISNQ